MRSVVRGDGAAGAPRAMVVDAQDTSRASQDRRWNADVAQTTRV